jgi:tetratricopeptide (TPR) repeat protein
MISGSDSAGAADGDTATDRQPTTSDNSTQALPEYEEATEISSPRSRRAAYQLPHDPPVFVGRHVELADIRAFLLRPARGTDAATRVALITGIGGVGKTALAIHVAHLVKSHYPDGQLFISLAGTSRASLSTADVLEYCLRALGVASESIPDAPDLRAALYASLLRRKRALIILDNAIDAAQLLPLLPADTRSAVIVTSRNPLAGIDATHFELEVLSETEAIELFIRLIGEDRVNADPAAAASVVRSCGYLPLAIRIAAARITSETPSSVTLEGLAEQLSDESGRLGVFEDTNRSLRAALQFSVDGLSPEAGYLFRLLGAVQLPDIDANIAAILLNSDPDRAKPLLEEIGNRGLLQQDAGPEGRYRLHDLTRLYAGELAETIEESGAYDLAARRVLTWLLENVHAGAVWFDLSAPKPLGWPSSLEEAFAWLEGQRRNIAAGVETAAARGFDDLAAQLPAEFGPFLEQRSYWVDAERLHSIAIDAARRAGRRDLEARALINLGTAFRIQGRLDEAVDYLQQGITVARELGDRSD